MDGQTRRPNLGGACFAMRSVVGPQGHRAQALQLAIRHLSTATARHESAATSACLWPGRRDNNLNPYIDAFSDSIEQIGFEVSDFRPLDWIWRPVSRHGELFIHWPEAATLGKSRLAQSITHLAFVARLFLYRRSGGKVIWIFHNLSLIHI